MGNTADTRGSARRPCTRLEERNPGLDPALALRRRGRAESDDGPHPSLHHLDRHAGVEFERRAGRFGVRDSCPRVEGRRPRRRSPSIRAAITGRGGDGVRHTPLVVPAGDQDPIVGGEQSADHRNWSADGSPGRPRMGTSPPGKVTKGPCRSDPRHAAVSLRRDRRCARCRRRSADRRPGWARSVGDRVGESADRYIPRGGWSVPATGCSTPCGSSLASMTRVEDGCSGREDHPVGHESPPRRGGRRGRPASARPTARECSRRRGRHARRMLAHERGPRSTGSNCA